MITNIFIISHLLLDFTFQSSDMARKKKTSFKCLAVHGLIYLVGCGILSGFFLETQYAIYTIAILSISHFVIDWVRQRLELKFTNNTFKFVALILDQGIHIAIIIASSSLLKLSEHTGWFYHMISGYEYISDVILYIFLFVVIWAPASVFIKKLFEFILIDDCYMNENDLKMGNLIGKLERVIVTILVLQNQYGVIGLVLTAKSIARFKQLEEKDFAEKYLVGTLTSLTIALIATIIIKKFL